MGSNGAGDGHQLHDGAGDHLACAGLHAVDGLRRDAFTASRTTVYIQSFEVANLKAIRNKIGSSQPNWKLVQLMGTSSRQPYDFVVAKDSRTFGDMMTSGLRCLRTI